MSIAKLESDMVTALCDKIRESGEDFLQAVNRIYDHELWCRVDKITLIGMIDTKGKVYKWEDLRCPMLGNLVTEFL
jgi:hypothetical protein